MSKIHTLERVIKIQSKGNRWLERDISTAGDTLVLYNRDSQHQCLIELSHDGNDAKITMSSEGLHDIVTTERNAAAIDISRCVDFLFLEVNGTDDLPAFEVTEAQSQEIDDFIYGSESDATLRSLPATMSDNLIENTYKHIGKAALAEHLYKLDRGDFSGITELEDKESNIAFFIANRKRIRKWLKRLTKTTYGKDQSGFGFGTKDQMPAALQRFYMEDLKNVIADGNADNLQYVAIADAATKAATSYLAQSYKSFSSYWIAS